jgi:hypothetical protein
VHRHLPRSRLVLVVSPGESLDSEWDRRDSGVFVVASLLGVSRLETRLGGPPVLAAVQGCFRGAMHAIADESKTMLSRDRPNSAVYLL